VIWPSVLAAFPRITRQLEGDIPHLYLDVRGLVTIAWGVLVDPLTPMTYLPLVHADGRPATYPEIAVEWGVIKGTPDLAHLGASAARPLCELHLTPDGVRRVVQARLDATVADLCRRYPTLATWPADAQLALLLGAWATGTASPYPKRDAALARGDYLTAADECRIAGNAPRSQVLVALYIEAHESVRLGADPSLLRYRG
jgi:hypothetical protein